jgi:HJR/Mrr/RecB family endonuclease
METEAAAVEIAASKGAARISPLREQLSEISLMSGVEFERFTASVFEALGYDATLVGGAGDQGVDLVLRKGAEVVAVQCKNYGQPIGNRPVQEVYAGARHHGIDQAWVVAPRGYTRGAVELARSTGVTLYDRARIEDLVRQAEQRHMARGCYGLGPSTVIARCRKRQAKATKCSPATVSGNRS